MIPIQKKVDSQISEGIRSLIYLPIIIGITVIFFTETAGWISFLISHHKMPKGGIYGFLMGFFIETFLGQIIPFLIIAMIIRGLIRKGASTREIITKLAFMLIPVSIVTAYWLFKYIDPFARGLLLFINFGIVLMGLLVGTVVMKTQRA